jgi:hypothetical protein
MRILATSSSTSSFCMNSSRTRVDSSVCFLVDSSSVIRLMVQPVSSEARRTFWPLLPMAMARFSSSTTTSIECFSSSTRIELTSAGASAPMTNCAGSADHSTMSTRSPASSCVTACTREPRMPTQVPIGSMRRSLVCTAILARTPGSRAADLISSSPSSISGTSSSKSFMMNCGAVRDRISCGPRAPRSIFITQARTRSPTRRFSFGIMFSRGSSASSRPDSTIALPRSMRFTVPVTSSSPRERKSLRICSRSASRMRCRITCLAVCAPMRPKGTFSIDCSRYSSILASALRSCASSSDSICAVFHSGVSSGTTCQRRNAW